jgi:alpha-beta hydrolase superfamily lysophospholipase
MVKMVRRMGFSMESLGITDAEFPNLAKIRVIALPTLIIHAESDSLIPLSEARNLFENTAAKDKRLVIIPGADHNTLMLVGMDLYFEAIRDFVFG